MSQYLVLVCERVICYRIKTWLDSLLFCVGATYKKIIEINKCDVDDYIETTVAFYVGDINVIRVESEIIAMLVNFNITKTSM